MRGVCSMKNQGSSNCTAGSAGAQMQAKIELKRNSCRTSEKLVRSAPHKDFAVHFFGPNHEKYAEAEVQVVFNRSTCCNLRATVLFVERKRHDFVTSTVVSNSRCLKNFVNGEFQENISLSLHLNI